MKTSVNGLLSVIFFFFLVNRVLSQEKGIISLDGTWQFREQGSKRIYNAQVPGMVHLDLYRNHIIPDPFYAANEDKMQWISDTGWVYERYFQLDRDFFVNRHVELVCEGLDTYARVFINDSLVLTADNMFKSWYVSVKRFLRMGYNKIRIEFPSVNLLNKTFYSQLPYRLPGDERVVCRKAAYQFGWDFCPRFPTMGIWKPVYLRYWKYINVLGAHFIQKSLTDSVAKMSAAFVINSTIADTAELRLLNDTTVFFSGREKLEKGINRLWIDFDILGPKRWNPNGWGAPTLYNFGYQVAFAGRVEGEGNKKIGLRTVELVQEADSIGRSFFLKINGKPVFIRGANWVPPDVFPTRVTDSVYNILLTAADQANLNMLRVWGGGIYENDIFYDLCDQKGIMVWQDFMFANAMYPDTPEFLNSVRDEAIQNIVRLRQHPSLVLWCGNNEIDEGWQNWGWVKEFGYSKEDSMRIYNNYKKMFRQEIPYAVLKHDTLRPYVSTSPKHGWGRSASLSEGDMHYWGVWWGKEPFSKYDQKVGRFMSEYGFQGFPDLTTLEKFTRPMDRILGSAIMKAHQKHPAGFETIDEYMKRDFQVPTDFNMYAYVSQLLQADGVKTAIDAHRRAKPVCLGTMFWQWNDPWPGVTWSAIDYFGKKKALYYLVKREYRDFFVQPVVENGRLKVYATFDEPDPQKANFRAVLSDFSGKVLWQEKFIYTFPADRTVVIADTNLNSVLDGADPASLFVYAEIQNILGVRATNIFYFVPPKEMKLEKATIERTVQKSNDGYVIDLYTTKLAKGVYLSTSVKGEFTDNYFDLLPFEEKKVTFKTTEHVDDMDSQITLISLVDSYTP